jgi:trans-aconitate methyltransferase
MAKTTWTEVWESRVEAPRKMNHVDLLRANGYDNQRSTLMPWNLASAQEYYWSIINLQPEDTVFEVGCGSGAFLFPLFRDRHKVGGIDLSGNLIELAKINLPTGNFVQGQAIDVDTTEKWDHVLSFGLFFYLPDMKYAEALLDKMVEKANKTVCLYELPDEDLKEECEEMRRATTPNYDRDYADLKHLYFNKKFFIDYARKRKLHCTVFDQVIPNYENGKYRFCVVLRKKM